MKKTLDEKIFNAVLLVVLAVAIGMSFSYNPTARGFPLFFGVLGFVMITLQLLSYVMASPPAFIRKLTQQASLNSTVAAESGAEQEASMSWGKYAVLIACLVGYMVLILYLDYLWATLIFLVFFMRFAGAVKWMTTIVYSIVFTGVLYVLFEYLIKP